jgi:hypothetical protein
VQVGTSEQWWLLKFWNSISNVVQAKHCLFPWMSHPGVHEFIYCCVCEALNRRNYFTCGKGLVVLLIILDIVPESILTD